VYGDDEQRLGADPHLHAEQDEHPIVPSKAYRAQCSDWLPMANAPWPMTHGQCPIYHIWTTYGPYTEYGPMATANGPWPMTHGQCPIYHTWTIYGPYMEYGPMAKPYGPSMGHIWAHIWSICCTGIEEGAQPPFQPALIFDHICCCIPG